MVGAIAWQACCGSITSLSFLDAKHFQVRTLAGLICSESLQKHPVAI